MDGNIDGGPAMPVDEAGPAAAGPRFMAERRKVAAAMDEAIVTRTVDVMVDVGSSFSSRGSSKVFELPSVDRRGG